MKVLQGKNREAMRDAEEAVRAGPATSQLFYNASRIYARCGIAYEWRAIELLGQALVHMPVAQRKDFWTTHVRKDPALQSLRRSTKFLQLEAEQTSRK